MTPKRLHAKHCILAFQTLKEALESEISGKFLDLALLLIKSPWEVMAEALYKAMKGAGTKERVLNEILAGVSKGDIEELKKAYVEGECLVYRQTITLSATLKHPEFGIHTTDPRMREFTQIL